MYNGAEIYFYHLKNHQEFEFEFGEKNEKQFDVKIEVFVLDFPFCERKKKKAAKSSASSKRRRKKWWKINIKFLDLVQEKKFGKLFGNLSSFWRLKIWNGRVSCCESERKSENCHFFLLIFVFPTPQKLIFYVSIHY